MGVTCVLVTNGGHRVKEKKGKEESPQKLPLDEKLPELFELKSPQCAGRGGEKKSTKEVDESPKDRGIKERKDSRESESKSPLKKRADGT